MGKAAAVLLALLGLAVMGRLDRGGRLFQGHVGGEVLGFRLQVDLRVTHGTRAAPADTEPASAVAACVLPDSLWETVTWP
jgi:hypothetical protein